MQTRFTENDDRGNGRRLQGTVQEGKEMTEPLPDVLFDDPIAEDTFEQCDRCGEEILPDDPRYADDEWGIICEDCWVEGGCD